MRITGSQKCRKCGLPAPDSGPCARHELVSGRRTPPAQSSLLAFQMTLGGILLGVLPSIGVGMAFHGGIGACSFFVFGPLVGTLLGYLGSRIELRRAERRHAAQRDAARRAASELPWASDAGEGLVRLRGRVRIVRGVPDPILEKPAAAWIDYRGNRACGRFEVIGDGVIGVVDDDLLELWDDALWDPVLRDGDQVEVAGRARHEALDDVEEGYRDAAFGLVFDGRPGRPVQVFRLRPG